MSNDNTRISSLAVSHVNRLSHRMVVCQTLNTHSLRWIKSFFIPYSGQLRCKQFAIILISSLVRSLDPMLCSVLVNRLPLNRFQHIYHEQFRDHFQHKSLFSHLFRTSRLHIERMCLESFITTIKLNVDNQKRSY